MVVTFFYYIVIQFQRLIIIKALSKIVSIVDIGGFQTLDGV